MTANCAAGVEDVLPEKNDSLRKVAHAGFRTGEKLKYKISWLFKGINVINVGFADLELEGIVFLKGRYIYKAGFSARSAPFFDVFFKIRDYATSYIDREGLFSWGMKMDINEGKSHYVRESYFDQVNNCGIHTVSYRQVPKKAKILPYMQDFMSAVYFARSLDMEKLGCVTFNIDNDGFAYEATLKFICKEKLDTAAGKFYASKLDLSWHKAGRKKAPGKESHFLWISADKYRYPLQVESIGEIGKFVTSLIGIEGQAKK